MLQDNEHKDSYCAPYLVAVKSPAKEYASDDYVDGAAASR